MIIDLNINKLEGKEKIIKSIDFTVDRLYLDEKSGTSEDVLIGNVTVSFHKPNGINILGQDVAFEDSVKIPIPDELEQDFINIWRKIEDML